MTIKQTPQTFAFLIAAMKKGASVKYKLTKEQDEAISDQIAQYFFDYFINSLTQGSQQGNPSEKEYTSLPRKREVSESFRSSTR